MKRRSLEIRILSANNLSKVGFQSKIKPYVIVSLKDPALSLKQETTPVDKTGNENPRWNFPVKFTLNETALQNNSITLQLQVFSRRIILPDALIGQVHLSALDLFSNNVEKTSSYQITCKRTGKPTGTVNFSYKFGDEFTTPTYQKPKQQVARQLHGGGRSNNGIGSGTGCLDASLVGLVVGDLVSDTGNQTQQAAAAAAVAGHHHHHHHTDMGHHHHHTDMGHHHHHHHHAGGFFDMGHHHHHGGWWQ